MQSLGEHYGTKFNIFLNKQTCKIQTWFTKFSPTKRIIILFSIFAALLVLNLLFIS